MLVIVLDATGKRQDEGRFIIFLQMIVQVYEIQTEEEAIQVLEAGVDHPGILVGEGEFPREVPLDHARRIFQVIPSKSKKLALTLSKDFAKISRIVEQLAPDILHIGTLIEWIHAADVVLLKQLFPNIQMMRSIPVTGAASVEIAKSYDGIADYLLLDSHQQEDAQIGATGRVHDWEISRQIVQTVRIPVILAGGLGPENVQQAIQKVRPAGVDSKTKTDAVGTHRKDLKLVRAFVQAARTV